MLQLLSLFLLRKKYYFRLSHFNSRSNNCNNNNNILKEVEGRFQDYMSVASCFWALLSLENFDFIYLPEFITDTYIGYGKTVGDILLNHSLLHFIHPEELSLARVDLMNFVQIKTLAGAVTRCRLKSIKSIIYQQQNDGKSSPHLPDWIITDVVMYTATSNAILTFFHSHEIFNDEMSTTSNCGTQQELHLQDSTTLSEILKLHSIPKDPLRIFEIYDTQSRQLIISCPSCLYTTHVDEDTTLLIQSATELAQTITLREMDKRTQQQQQPKQARTTCTHYSHSNTTAMLPPHGLCRVETIIITYGSLTFSTYQITPMMIESSSSSNNALHHSTNTCSYHHYIRCDPVIDSDRSITRRKSNIKDILNNTTEITTPIPKKYNTNINTSTNIKSSSSSSSSTTTTTTTTTSPRAWRGRFGAYEKKCENCQTNASPEWRRGPSGHKTLCNACGLRYARSVAKNERQQAPKEEDLYGKFKHSNTTK